MSWSNSTSIKSGLHHFNRLVAHWTEVGPLAVERQVEDMNVDELRNLVVLCVGRHVVRQDRLALKKSAE